MSPLRSTWPPTSTTTSADATFGVELVRRAARENEGSELGAFLSSWPTEIEADREALQGDHGRARRQGRSRQGRGRLGAEKMGRLKPNAQLRGYSPLSPLVELEGLLVGIQGKLSMWRALAEVAEPLGLDPARLQGLAARAVSQQADVERHRLDVARRALTAA